MTMVPAPKLSNSKPHLVFYGGCAGAPADIMTRFADGCSPPPGYVSYNTTNIINGNTCIDTTTTAVSNTGNEDNIISSKVVTDNNNNNVNCVLGSDLGVSCYRPNTNNYGSSYHNIFLMAEEEHSRTSNSTSANDDGDQQQPAAATAAAASMKGRDDTPTPTPTPPPPPRHHHHHQGVIVDSSSSWLQLGLGRTHVDSPPPPSFQQQYHQTQAQVQAHHQMSSSSQMGAGGLMLDLNLGGGGCVGGNGGGNSGGVIPLMMIPGLEPARIPQRQQQIDRNLFIGSPTYIPHHQQHHPMIPLIASLPQPQLQSSSHHLMLSDHHIQQQQQQINWGYANHQRLALSAAAGCSSSLSPSSSSSMPPAVSGAGSFLTRPFTPSGSSSVDAVDSEFRVIHPPPRRPHTGIWFSLQASLHQSKQPFLPQVSKSFLRIKDERMTVRLVMKYVANKLGLDSESEVEIRCRGQQLVPYLTLQHVRDNIWSSSDAAVTTVTLLPDSSTTDHLMVLNYARSTSSSSTYLASST